MISRIGRVLIGATVSGALVFACTPSIGDDVVLVKPPAPPPPLASPDAAASETDASSAGPGLCPSSECPFPLLTCASSTFLCDVDPRTSNENCGGCGNVCDSRGLGAVFNGAFECVNGTCMLICNGDKQAADCDGIPENGCETLLWTDNHCAACNDVCSATEKCILGKCVGCTPPKMNTACGCKDLSSDDENCGACHVECPRFPADLPPPPPHAYYGCSGGQCGVLKCDNGSNTNWTDCNGDLPQPNGDGCEINLAEPSMAHCGACDIQCAPGETCGAPGPLPELKCLCGPGEVNCGLLGGKITCADLDTDARNCGACGRACPNGAGSASHGISVCRAGNCGFACDHGWSDCNDFLGDGCETNVRQDPANCGACGHACEGGPSQACVEGRCVVEDCKERNPQ